MMLSETLKKTEELIRKYNAPFSDELSRINEDFKRMSDFFAMGNYDPDLEKIYGKLNFRAENLLWQVILYNRTIEDPFCKKMLSDTKGNYTLDLELLRNRLEDFVIDITMLDLESDESTKAEKSKQVFAKQHEYRKVMFAQVVLAAFHEPEDATALEEIILSSSIDNIDAQLLIAALMLSCTASFDKDKANILYNVYSKATDEDIRQKAIVSYILSCSNADATYDFGANKIEPQLLAQIQQQLLYTLDSPRVEKIMQHDIMPDIIKNSDFDFQNNRIIPKKKDSLEEILNPHKDEEMIEKMEETMKRMQKLQEQGSDLFFGGFRYVKNTPFFNDIINWFCPFNFNHPNLPDFDSEDDKRIVSKLISRAPFCDSDKYSFVISMRKAIGTIPENMKQMLKNGEAQLDIVGGGTVVHNEAFIRRTYLQDIFRFYHICSWARSLKNVMDINNCLVIKNFVTQENNGYDQATISVLKALRKFDMNSQAQELLKIWNPSTKEGYIFKAFSLVKHNQSSQAASIFNDLLKDDPHNIQALYGITKACFEDYSCASYWHDHKDSAIQALMALYFKNENDLSVLHNLVKAYLLAGDHEKALKYSQELTDKKKAEPFVISFIGIYNFSHGNIKAALTMFKQSGENINSIIKSADNYGLPISPIHQDLLRNI